MFLGIGCSSRESSFRGGNVFYVGMIVCLEDLKSCFEKNVM